MTEEIFRFKKEKNGNLYGVFNYPNKLNNNGFVITEDAMKKSLDEFWICNNPVFGHLGSDRERCADIDMTQISHQIVYTFQDKDGNFGAELKILDTPMGKTLKEMIDSGADLQFNGVYTGVVNEETKEVEDLKIVTIDIVPVG